MVYWLRRKQVAYYYDVSTFDKIPLGYAIFSNEKMCILCILGWNIVRRASPTKKINYDKDKERINEAEYMGIIFKPYVFTDGCCC